MALSILEVQKIEMRFNQISLTYGDDIENKKLYFMQKSHEFWN